MPSPPKQVSRAIFKYLYCIFTILKNTSKKWGQFPFIFLLQQLSHFQSAFLYKIIFFLFFFNTVLLHYVSSHSLSSSNFYTVSLQNAIWKQLLIFNKLLEFYKLISLNHVSPTDPKPVKQFKNCISMQAKNRLSAPKQVAMQTVISKLVNKIYLLSRLK